MKALKWNVKTRKYEEYTLPTGCFLMSNDMEELVACAQCGHLLEFGITFTSLEVHTHIGLGYPVCEACYDAEMKRRNLYES